MKPDRDEFPMDREEAEQALFAAVALLESPDECRRFLLDLCTPAELQALVDRWQVVTLLQEGMPYRKIHDLTGVSVTTIGRVARFLHDGSGGYQTVFDRSQALAAEHPHKT